MKIFFSVFIGLFLLSGLSVQAQDSRADQLFEQARLESKEDIAKGRVLYEASALAYLEDAGDSYIGRGVALYNAGNAFAMAGTPGQAILALRKAQRHLPELEYLNDNLNQLRNLVGTRVEEPVTGLWSRVMAWDKTSWGIRLAYIALAYLVLWGFLLNGLWKGQRIHRGLTSALIVILFALSLSVFLDVLDWQKANEGVVVVRTVEARKGDGYGYHAAFQMPLREGAEFTVIETRGEWLRVALSEDSTCWLPIQAVELF